MKGLVSREIVIPRSRGNKTRIFGMKRVDKGEFYYYYHFVWHCGALYGLKLRIWRAKMYFSPLK